MPMDQRYTWRAAAPGATLSVHIASIEDGERAFDATLNLRRRPLTAPLRSLAPARPCGSSRSSTATRSR